jgi:CHAT domain-containing protein
MPGSAAGRPDLGQRRVRLLTSLLLTGLAACAPSPPPPPASLAFAPPRRTLTAETELARTAVPAPSSDGFEAVLRPGDLLELVATQEGADVALRLRTPEGREAVRVDSPIGKRGQERLLFQATEGGVYGLDVEVLSVEPGGGYTLRVPRLRPARGDEAQHADATTTFARAEELRRAQRWAEAIELYREALAAFRELGLGDDEERALRQLARAHRGAGQHEEEARALERLPEPRSASDWLSLARVRVQLGRAEAAFAANHAGRERARQAGDRGAEALALHQLAGQLRDAGRLPAAEWAYERAASLYRVAGRPGDEALVLLALTSLYVEVNALELAERTLALARALPLAPERGPFADLQAAEVARLAGRAREAQRLAEGVLGAGAADAAVLDRARALLLQLARDRQDWPEAETRARERLDRLAPGSAEATLALQDLGQILAYRGELGEARRALEQAQAAARAQPPRVRAAILAGLARVARGEGRLHAAWTAATDALELVEGVREGAERSELRLAWTSDTQDFFDLAVDTALELARQEPGADHLARALETSERGRARALLDELAPQRAPLGKRAPLEDRQRELERRRGGLIAAGARPEELALTERELADVVAALEAFPAPDLTRLDAIPPPAARSTGPGRRSASALAIAGELVAARPDLQILELDLGEERSHLFRFDAGGLTAHRLPGRVELEELARQVHTALARSTSLAAGARPSEASAALGQALLGGIAGELRDGPILFVPDGALWLVPLGSLPLPGEDRPLLERHEVVQAPSLTALGALRRQRPARLPAEPRVAVFADPVFHSSDPRLSLAAEPLSSRVSSGAEALRGTSERLERLEHSAREAEVLRELVPAARLVVGEGFAATKARLRALPLADLDILHLATHGFFDSQEPSLSGLVLTLVDERGRPLDGVLRAHEIAELALGARLVVASACSTAQGRAFRGEGVVSLAQAFFRAGAPQVVVSLWPVSDRATAELMRLFYRALLLERLPPAAALRQAQLAVRADPRWRAPYYWAAFVLQGDL